MAVSEVPTTDPMTAIAKNNFFMGITTVEEWLLFGIPPYLADNRGSSRHCQAIDIFWMAVIWDCKPQSGSKDREE
jgi:hypothetical protein